MFPTIKEMLIKIYGGEELRDNAIELMKCGRDVSLKTADSILSRIPENQSDVCREYGQAMMKIGESQILDQLQKLLSNVPVDKAEELIDMQLKNCKSMKGGNIYD